MRPPFVQGAYSTAGTASTTPNSSTTVSTVSARQSQAKRGRVCATLHVLLALRTDEPCGFEPQFRTSNRTVPSIARRENFTTCSRGTTWAGLGLQLRPAACSRRPNAQVTMAVDYATQPNQSITSADAPRVRRTTSRARIRAAVRASRARRCCVTQARRTNFGNRRNGQHCRNEQRESRTIASLSSRADSSTTTDAPNSLSYVPEHPQRSTVARRDHVCEPPSSTLVHPQNQAGMADSPTARRSPGDICRHVSFSRSRPKSYGTTAEMSGTYVCTHRHAFTGGTKGHAVAVRSGATSLASAGAGMCVLTAYGGSVGREDGRERSLTRKQGCPQGLHAASSIGKCEEGNLGSRALVRGQRSRSDSVTAQARGTGRVCRRVCVSGSACMTP